MTIGRPQTTNSSSARASLIRIIEKASLKTLLFITLCMVTVASSPLLAAPEDPKDRGSSSQQKQMKRAPRSGKVIGLKYNCLHVLKLEKTLKLYREILGFKMEGAEVYHAKGIEGMLVMKLDANGCKVHLSLPSPEHADTVGPIGNTNHNHFMLLVDDIVPIGDQLKKEGYALENEAYARDKYTFFTGPNGEIIGLTEFR